MNEENKFSAEVRKFNIGRPWEEITKNESDAEMVGTVLEHRLRELGMKLDLKNSKVLEVGSGKSVFLNYLQKKGVDAVGVDTRPRGETDGLQVVAARIEQLPFSDETFDVIFSNSVFDANAYNQDHRRMLEEISRVLKHGGIHVSTSNDVEADESVAGLALISGPKNSFLNIYRKS